MKTSFRSLALGCTVAVVLGAAALAQIGVTPPQVQTVSPTADRIQVVPNGAPQAQSQYASPAQITAVHGYYKSVPLTGFTYTFSNAVGYAAFNPAGTLAALYIVLAPSPSDGTRACIFSSQTITALYVAANTGQSINNAISGTSLSANTGACYLYSASNLTWDRD